MSQNESGHEAASSGKAFREVLHSWRFFFYFLGLALLVPLFFVEENWRGSRAWSRYRQERARQGDLLDPAHYVPPPALNSENFALTPTFAPLFDFVPGTQKTRDPNALKRAQQLTARYESASSVLAKAKAAGSNSWLGAELDLQAWHAAFLTPTNHEERMSWEKAGTNCTVNEAAAGVLAALTESEALVTELRAASRRRRSRFNLHYEEDCPASILLPHLSVLKRLTQVLQLRATAELALERDHEAFLDVLLMLELADAAREEPIVVSSLVRLAQMQLTLPVIAQGIERWPPESLQVLQERLQRFDFCADVRRALEAERVLFGGGVIDFVRRSADQGTLAALAGPDIDPATVLLLRAAPGGWFDLEKVNYHRLFETCLLPTIDPAARRIDPAASRIADEKLDQTQAHPFKRLLSHQVFSSLLVPRMSQAAQKTAFVQTGVDAAALACALQRYRLEHGKYPEALSALSPVFVSAIPHDLITGLPLKYHRCADVGYELYSVGWNEKDDGGQYAKLKSGESADVREGDWVWRPIGKTEQGSAPE